MRRRTKRRSRRVGTRYMRRKRGGVRAGRGRWKDKEKKEEDRDNE